jgi:CBS-domain-containing membrane protein
LIYAVARLDPNPEAAPIQKLWAGGIAVSQGITFGLFFGIVVPDGIAIVLVFIRTGGAVVPDGIAFVFAFTKGGRLPAGY